MDENPYCLLSKNTDNIDRKTLPKNRFFIPFYWCFLFSLAFSTTATGQLEEGHLCEPIFDTMGSGFWNDTICAGALAVPFTLYSEVPDSCMYEWTLENVDKGIIDTLETGYVTEVFIDFPDPGEYEICVSATNLNTSTDPVCNTVWVAPLTPITTIDTICKREPYEWVGPFSEILETYESFTDDWGFGLDPNPDPFEDLRMAVNQGGCMVDVMLELYVIPDNYLPTEGDDEYFQEVICSGDYFVMPNGGMYFQTGVYGTEGDIFIPQQSFPQCDSFFIIDLSVLDVSLAWADPVCKDNAILISPKEDPFPPEVFPGGAGQEISIQWVRMSDNDTLFIGTISQGTFEDSLFWEITPDDFNSDIETFEVNIITDLDGEPDPGCVLGPWCFDLDINDFFPPTPELTGPETVIRDSLLVLTAALPSGDIDSTLQYQWKVFSESNSYSIVNDDSTDNIEVLFHTTGIHEVCLYTLIADRECGRSKTVCHEILVEEAVPVIDGDREEWHLKVFPNPAEDHLIVESDDLKGLIEISIIGLEGRPIKTYTELFDKRSLIELDGLPAGMYFIQIYFEETYIQQPFFKKIIPKRAEREGFLFKY